MRNRMCSLLLLTAAIALTSQPARSQDFSNIRIVRLSFVEGDVQFQRPGQDWQDARLNLPIEEGFALRTPNGYAEVEFEDALALHLGINSTAEFTHMSLQNGGRVTRLTIPEGTAIVTARLRRGDAVSIVAGNYTLTVPHDARFRMDISPADSWVTVFHGNVGFDPGTGTTALLTSGHTLHENSNGSASPEIAGNPPQDDFDKWVFHREEAMNSAQSDASEALGTSGYTMGYADLYDYGNWSMIPGYGQGWMPFGVGAGWMPFTAGQWSNMGGLGWNWLSAEPWGWLPYHFGSWVNAPGLGWAWIPGSHSQLNWTPANARWVQVNNQLGWIPNGPPQSAKPTKTQLAAIPTTAILAAQGETGALRAGAQVRITSAGTSVQPAAAPAFVASSVSSSAMAHPRASNMPATLRAPSDLHGTRPSSMPRAMLAPHSAPVPAISYTLSVGGFRGGYSGRAGINGSGLSGTSAPPTSASGVSAGSGSHSGGSSGGHH
jgi:hypothetical protein